MTEPIILIITRDDLKLAVFTMVSNLHPFRQIREVNDMCAKIWEELKKRRPMPLYNVDLQTEKNQPTVGENHVSRETSGFDLPEFLRHGENTPDTENFSDDNYQSDIGPLDDDQAQAMADSAAGKTDKGSVRT